MPTAILLAALGPPVILIVLELLFICAFIALVWWGIGRIGVPEPIRTIILVILGVIALVVLWQIVMGGHLIA